MKLRVLFRVDASLEIGSGHVVRCLALAEALRSQGVECMFVCREQEGHLGPSIEKRGFRLALLAAVTSRSKGSHYPTVGESSSEVWGTARLGCSEYEDAAEVVRVVRVPGSWSVVVDHYSLGNVWEALLRPHFNSIVAIDDLGHRFHECDVLVDQNLGRTSSDYDCFVPATCRRLIGPSYALIRPEFAELRPSSLARRVDGRCDNILVTMGGVDNGNATVAVLEALDNANLPSSLRITVVLGAAAPWKEEVRARVRSMRLRAELVVDAFSMAELMRDSDLAIGAAGSTSWERCCMGLPAIQVALADNQNLIAKALDLTGGAISIERDRIKDDLGAACVSLLRDPGTVVAMSTVAASVTDGLGARRVARLLSKGALV